MKHSLRIGAMLCSMALACSAAQPVLNGLDKACEPATQLFDGGPEGVVVCATLSAIDDAIAAYLAAENAGKPKTQLKPKTADELSPAERAGVSKMLAKDGAKVVRP